jgi:hypothetical protein
MKVSVENAAFSCIRIGRYLVCGDCDLLSIAFTDLNILRYQQSFDFTHNYLAGKLLSNDEDHNHLCGSVFPIPQIDELCIEALDEASLEV